MSTRPNRLPGINTQLYIVHSSGQRKSPAQKAGLSTIPVFLAARLRRHALFRRQAGPGFVLLAQAASSVPSDRS